MILPLRHALCACHPLTAAVSLCRFATSPSHCEGVYPNKRGGLRNGTTVPYGCRGDSRIARSVSTSERGHKRREQNSPNSGTLRQGQAPALLYYNRHFPEQGNHPALPWKFHFVRRGRRLGAPLFLPLMRVDSLTV